MNCNIFELHPENGSDKKLVANHAQRTVFIGSNLGFKYPQHFTKIFKSSGANSKRIQGPEMKWSDLPNVTR